MKKLIMILMGCFSLTANAIEPLFSIVPQGTLPTTVVLSGTATAKYTVANNSPYTLSNLGLSYQPAGATPIGVTQVLSSNTCADPFTLGAYQSCTLELSISGMNLVGGVAVGGPDICFTEVTPSRCSVPELAAQLNVSLSASSNLALAGGAAVFSTKPSAFVVQSNDNLNWALSSIPSQGDNSQVQAIACNSTYCFAGGTVTTNPSSPFIVQTLDDGLTWTNAALTVTDGGIYQGESACNELTCIAAGNTGGSADGIYQGLLSGAIWTWSSVQGLPDAYFNDSACGSNMCVVVGQNTAPNITLVQTIGSSGTWASGLSSSTIPGLFVSVGCSGTVCVAVGDDQSSNPDPIAYWTSNSGGAWAPTNTDLTMLFSYSDITLNTASCSGSFCIGGGVEYGGNMPPPLMYSTDAGQHWTAQDLTSLNIVSGGGLDISTCTETVCLVLGIDGNGDPLLLQTLNQGVSWQQIDLSAFSSSGIYINNAISCQSSYCTLSFNYKSIGSTVSVLIQSTNAGTNWELVTPTGLPAGYTYYATFAGALNKLQHKIQGMLK